MTSGVSQPPEPEMPVDDQVAPPRRPGDVVSVLLVEDNLGDARLVEEHLASGFGSGHEVTHCKRLSDAIGWLDDHRCDLVLLDLSLPDSRGLATLQQLLGHAFGVPVVVLTGTNDEAQAYQAIQSGAQDYLHKDAVDPVRLARTVRYAIERKQWEDSVRTSDEQLHRLEKSDAIARLCEGLAHNFNNILTSILGNCELLLARIAQDDKATRYAENIQDAARQAAEQTRELKSFCRERKAQPQRVDLARFVRGLAPLLAGASSRRVDLNVVCDADDAWALADPGELEQVVLNLVQNAQAAVETVEPTVDGAQGEVRVRVRRIALARSRAGHPDTVPAGSYAVIEVVDDGPGVASDIAPRIFDSFFTTRGGKSAGLGLTTSLALVRRSHGFMVVDVPATGGAAFAVWLPRVAVEPPAPMGNFIKAPRGLESVLLVEDDPQIAAVIAETLSSHGYRILVASSGDEALEVFRTHPGDIGIVVSDIDMPGISGYELAQRLTALHPGTRIILISGHDSPLPAAQGLIAAFLPKPFSPVALAKTIREVVSEAKHQHA